LVNRNLVFSVLAAKVVETKVEMDDIPFYRANRFVKPFQAEVGVTSVPWDALEVDFASEKFPCGLRVAQ
jgi:hypothetical protein